jgi:hypothetical protein
MTTDAIVAAKENKNLKEMVIHCPRPATLCAVCPIAMEGT